MDCPVFPLGPFPPSVATIGSTAIRAVWAFPRGPHNHVPRRTPRSVRALSPRRVVGKVSTVASSELGDPGNRRGRRRWSRPESDPRELDSPEHLAIHGGGWRDRHSGRLVSVLLA